MMRNRVRLSGNLNDNLACPASSVTLTIPEMMHVWIVEPPGGPFAEGVDQAWAREYLEAHAIVL